MLGVLDRRLMISTGRTTLGGSLHSPATLVSCIRRSTVGQSRGVHHDGHGKCRAGGADPDEPIDRRRRDRHRSGVAAAAAGPTAGAYRRWCPPVTFSDVDFAYPDTGKQGVRRVLPHLDAGEFVALVGPSGAGKTSATHLLLRFYDPDSGRILIDGTDVSTQRLQDVRSHITLLPQRIAYRGSIADNIRFSCPGPPTRRSWPRPRPLTHTGSSPSCRRVRHTAARCGANLSGGQRQRIALARAFLRDTPVLILDEPTTGLDSATTERILEPMLRLARSRTTILITHDPVLARRRRGSSNYPGALPCRSTK